MPCVQLTILSTVAFATMPASSQTIRYANQGVLNSLDPYTLNETTTHAHLGHVYEGLIARDKDLKIIPGAGRELGDAEPTRWRFHLRKGVKFHNGDPFTADDVVFSADRVREPGFGPADPHRRATSKVVKVDDYTVDFILTSPQPDLQCAMGHLVHHRQEMGGGQQRGRADPGRSDHAQLRLAATPMAPAPSPSKATSPA